MATSPFSSWDTVRCELLHTRICDLRLEIEGSPIDPFTQRLSREFSRMGMVFRPASYLTDSWGCPDRVPVIGIPFYLADERLARIEEEQTGEIEDASTVMSLLRHEAGHAINYAYRLWDDPEWERAFGRFSKPYRDTFRPRPASREFVRHIFSGQHGLSYAQKHPDEDFAETFAVWLTPRSGWRRKYCAWPAMKKLTYVNELMGRLRKQPPVCAGGPLLNPVEELQMPLAEHYGQRTERFRAAAQGYVDDRLREVFPPVRGGSTLPAQALLREHHGDLLARIVRWSGLDEPTAHMVLAKLEDRARGLRLRFSARQVDQKLVDLAVMVTALAMEFSFTGRVLD